MSNRSVSTIQGLGQTKDVETGVCGKCEAWNGMPLYDMCSQGGLQKVKCRLHIQGQRLLLTILMWHCVLLHHHQNKIYPHGK